MGTYDGLYGSFSWEIDSEATRYYEEDTTAFTVNPSFFQISGGIKFFF